MKLSRQQQGGFSLLLRAPVDVPSVVFLHHRTSQTGWRPHTLPLFCCVCFVHAGFNPLQAYAVAYLFGRLTLHCADWRPLPSPTLTKQASTRCKLTAWHT